MRLSLIVPLAFSLAGLILTFLCILAGSKPGFMEDYQIVTLNTSTVGHDLFPKIPKFNNPFPLSTPLDGLINTMSGVTDQIDDNLDEIVDNVSRSLGISQFYNWHLRNFCEGMYKPSATANPAHFNVTYCSEPTAVYHFRIGDIIDKELKLGPLHIGLKNLQWPDSIQKNLDQLSTALHAAVAFFAISITALIPAILVGTILFIGTYTVLLSLIHMALLMISFVSLLVCSIIITAVNFKATKIVNDTGNKIGVYAYKGHKYLALTWCSAFVMLIAVISYGLIILLRKRNGERRSSEKKLIQIKI